MKTLFATRYRFAFLILTIVLCFGAVLGKLWWLHVEEAPRLRDEAIQARQVYRELAANRGAIVDARGVVLATAHEVWDIGVDAHALTDEDRARAGEVAAVLGLGRAVVAQAFEKHFRDPKPGSEEPRPIRWIKLADGVDEAVAARIEQLKIKGVYGTRKFVRDYPKEKLAAHLVGYVNKEGAPTMGVEKAMNWFLVGQCGSIQSQWDGRRTELAHLRMRQIEPVDGQKVELTIDSLVQEVCETELEKVRGEFQPKSATIIVSEAASGRLLGLANWPTFDLRKYNDRVAAPIENQRNRAVTDVYEPGSVFKIVSISMGLNEGVVTPNTVFDCGKPLAPYRGKMLALPGDSHSMGVVNVRDIVRESSNRGSVLVALRVAEAKGEQTLYDYAYKFGCGRPTGLITGTESSGILHAPKNWDGQTITRMPMGHAVSVTPLQIHYAMGVIASGGKLLAPILVSRVLNADDTVAFSYAPRVRETPITPQVARTMALMLRAVCKKGGTAAVADIEGYEVAGKTGTTQKIVNGTYSSQHHVASFSGFFPAENPQLVITVVIDEPKLAGVGYGGKVAAPVFRRVAEGIIRCLGIPPAVAPTPATPPQSSMTAR